MALAVNFAKKLSGVSWSMVMYLYVISHSPLGLFRTNGYDDVIRSEINKMHVVSSAVSRAAVSISSVLQFVFISLQHYRKIPKVTTAPKKK